MYYEYSFLTKIGIVGLAISTGVICYNAGKIVGAIQELRRIDKEFDERRKKQSNISYRRYYSG